MSALLSSSLRTRLLVWPALAGASVSWDERPRSGALPAITLTLIYPGAIQSQDGRAGLSNPRVQIDCWATGSALADQLADAVEAAMMIAPNTVVTFGGVNFSGGWLEDRQTYAPEDLGGDVRIYRRSVDFEFFWEPV